MDLHIFIQYKNTVMSPHSVLNMEVSSILCYWFSCLYRRFIHCELGTHKGSVHCVKVSYKAIFTFIILGIRKHTYEGICMFFTYRMERVPYRYFQCLKITRFPFG